MGSLTSFARYVPRSSGGQFIKATVDAAVEAGIQAWAGQVLDIAQGLVPVRTGQLKDSGHVETNGPTAAVVFDSPHAAFVEFGTGIRGAASPGAGDVEYSSTWPGMAAQPYLRPAYDAKKNDASAMVAQFIGVGLK
jgi:HK97 gp10 family phage protein